MLWKSVQFGPFPLALATAKSWHSTLTFRNRIHGEERLKSIKLKPKKGGRRVVVIDVDKIIMSRGTVSPSLEILEPRLIHLEQKQNLAYSCWQERLREEDIFSWDA